MSVTQFAASVAMREYQEGNIAVHQLGSSIDGDTRRRQADRLTVELSSYMPNEDNAKFTKGWAKRPKHGDVYGAKYVERFRHDIQMYESGNKDKGTRLGPGVIVTRLMDNKYEWVQE